MVEQDTIRLLRECDSGIKMGVNSIDEVMDNVTSHKLKDKLGEFRSEHVVLRKDMESLLGEYGDEGKDPPAMARGMSWIKTNVKLAVNDSDKTVAELMTDGCNMGVKSLNKYLNEYKAADEKSKDITKRLIDLEQRMTTEMQSYL